MGRFLSQILQIPFTNMHGGQLNCWFDLELKVLNAEQYSTKVTMVSAPISYPHPATGHFALKEMLPSTDVYERRKGR